MSTKRSFYLVLVWLVTSWPASLAAAEVRPLAVFVCSGNQRITEDLTFLGKGLPGLVVRLLSKQTGVEKLEGFDPNRPLGVVVLTDGLAVTPMAFAPLENEGGAAKLLASLAPAVGPARPAGNGLWKIGRGELTGFVRRRGAWAFLAQREENLDRLPDPPAVFGDLPQRYDAALQFNLRHVPEVFRTMAVDLIRLSMRKGLARREKETEAAHQIRRRLTVWQFRLLERFVTQCRRITLGWTLSGAEKQASLDLLLEPEPDSEFAAEVAASRNTKTRFGSLGVKDAPLSLNVNWRLSEAAAKLLCSDLRDSRAAFVTRIGELPWLNKSPEEGQTFQELAGTLLDILDHTIRCSHADLALAVEGQETPHTMIAAARVGKGDALNQAFETVAKLGQQDPRFAGFEVNVAKVNGADVHAVVFTNGRRQVLSTLFGEEIKLYVAFSAESIWVAIGPKWREALARAMAGKESEVTPVRLTVHLGALRRSAEKVIELGYLANLANLLEGDDRVILTVQATPDGLRVRAEAKQGVLRAAGGALNAALNLALLFGG